MSIIPTSSQTIHVKQDVVARAVGDEMVLLDLESGIYYTLNSVGATIWRSFEDALSVAQVIDRIVAEYDVDRSTATHDVGQLISDLVQMSLLAAA